MKDLLSIVFRMTIRTSAAYSNNLDSIWQELTAHEKQKGLQEERLMGRQILVCCKRTQEVSRFNFTGKIELQVMMTSLPNNVLRHQKLSLIICHVIGQGLSYCLFFSSSILSRFIFSHITYGQLHLSTVTGSKTE